MWRSACANYMGLNDVTEVKDDMPNDDWLQAGVVGVDSGQLMMCDPCYINGQWKKSGTERKAPPYRHKDGRILYCGLHGAAPADNAIRFENYDTVIDCYGKSMNQMAADGDVKKEACVFDNPGEFSYEGCCAATLSGAQSGQLNFKLGHAGAGVVFSTGYGDGFYPVYVRIVDDPDWGRRVAEARIVFIDPKEEDDDEGEDVAVVGTAVAELAEHEKKLCEVTDTKFDEWKMKGGPVESNVGLKYMYQHVEGRLAFVTVKDGQTTVQFQP